MAANGDCCPLCERPYAHQPTPSVSEMRLRDMPGSGASGQDDMGGNPLQEGILADGGWKNRQKRDESFASVKHANEFALPGLGEQAPPAINFNTAAPTHKFLVTGDGSVFSSPEPTTHEEIASHLGDTEAHLRGGALGQLLGNRDTHWFSNGTNLSPQELQHSLTQHYGYPVTVDSNHPGLRVRTQEERFGLPNVGRGRELSVLDGPALPRQMHTPIPGEKEWQLRGGKVANDLPMETEGVALPGHMTEDVTPSEYGLHGEVLQGLNDLGAYVNGRKIDVANDPEYYHELLTHYSPSSPPANGEEWRWPQNRGQPVIVSHPNPEHLQMAKQVVEAGSRAPLIKWAEQQEAGHPARLQLPHGITDNLHLALGNLRSWVENPYENGQLRPYYNHHRVVRPQLQNNQALNVGVGEPVHGEILNHIAQTDDLTPLYEYRGVKRSKTAGPAVIPAAEVAGEVAAPLIGDAAAGGIASGVGGLMRGALSAGKNLFGGLFGGGKNMAGRYLQFEGLHGLLHPQQGGGGAGGGGAGFAGAIPIQDASYYARTADIETPTSHGEIPKNNDGDSNQKNDGDSHEWQKDYDVNGTGGTDSPGMDFDPNGPGLERFLMMLPLIMHHYESDEPGESDPMLQSLDQALEQEIPGYKEHGTPDGVSKLIMMISPKDDGHEDDMVGNDDGSPEAKPAEPELEKETRVDFLPSLPSLEAPRHAFVPPTPSTGLMPTPGGPMGMSPSGPTMQGHCPHCGALTDPSNATCPQCGAALGGMPNHQDQSGQIQARVAIDMPNSFMYEQSDMPPEMNMDEYRHRSEPNFAPKPCPNCSRPNDPNRPACVHCGSPLDPMRTASDHQGPHTPEQISAVQQLLIDSNRIDEVPDVPLFPQNYVEELAQITQTDPLVPDDSMGAGQPEPAQEDAPPEDTMPVPGMSAPQQMASAVAKYAADSVARVCPECGSHTTRLLNNDGKSECHSCGHQFTSDVDYSDTQSTAKVADIHRDIHPNSQGVPAADQRGQEDVSQEQDSSHTWKDSNGQPLKVGQEYEMYSAKYDIPDVIRIDSVKPDEIEYTLTGEYGLEHSTAIDYNEAQIEQLNFVPTDGSQAELGPDDPGNTDNTMFEGTPETDDLSRPHALVAASAGTAREWLRDVPMNVPTVSNDETNREWLRQGGAHFTPMEQRNLIDESGTARNADLLDLNGTHYLANDDEDDEFVFGF